MPLKPAIRHVEVLHALQLPDGRTPVILAVDGAGLAVINGTRTWFRGPRTWRLLVPVPGVVDIALFGLGRVRQRISVDPRGPGTPRVHAPVTTPSLRLHRANLHPDPPLPAVPRFALSRLDQEPSDG